MCKNTEYGKSDEKYIRKDYVDFLEDLHFITRHAEACTDCWMDIEFAKQSYRDLICNTCFVICHLTFSFYFGAFVCV